MSIILDALRRGRGEQQPAPDRTASQTDAVLQTLGYRPLNPATPFNRLKRMLTYAALATVSGFMLWTVALWFTDAAAPPPHPPETRTDDHFGRAVMYQRLGDFENALVSYRHVLQRDDLNVEAHNNLGVLYRDKGLFDDAVRHFQRAIAINPGYANARNNLGVLYLAQRELDIAAAQFHAALAIDAKNVESMVNLSKVEKESGRHSEARNWLARAMQVDSHHAGAHYTRALLEDEAGNREEALAHYRAFLEYGAASHPELVADVRSRSDALAAR
jgi:tetratricopeptide (TPR) repeat protein